MAVRITSRLKILEESKAGAELSGKAERLLVSLLARFDALWWPFRTHYGSYRAEVRRLHREYLAERGGLRAASQGERNWKADHHVRNELIASRLASPNMSGQVTDLRLTPQGIADARAMVGSRLSTLNSPASIAAFIILERFEGCEHSGKWMIENKLFGDAVSGDNPAAWNDHTELLLPLLSCGAVESTSDLWNRVYYRAVPNFGLPTEPPSEATEQPWADGAYIRAFDAERAALQRLTCDDGGIFIPMRCT